MPELVCCSRRVQQYLYVTVPQQYTVSPFPIRGQSNPVFHFPNISVYPEQKSDPKTKKEKRNILQMLTESKHY